MCLPRLLGVSTLAFLLLAGCEKEGKDSGSKPASPASNEQAAAAKGTPVVTFKGGAITLEQLQGYIAQMNPAARTRLETPAQRREYAEGLARFELFVLEARRRGLENDPEVQEAMKRAMVQQLLFKEFDEKAPPVTPEEVSAYYEAHKAEFIQPARARYSHLLVPAPQGSPERGVKKKRAQALLEKARKLQPLDFDAFDALITEASGNPSAKTTEADTQLVTAEEL
jgi:peptidyl-prolyl cis-trans isomerase C